MVKNALSALNTKLKDFFKINEVYNFWPGPDVKAKYPYMTVLLVTSNLVKWSPKQVDKTTAGFVFSVGQQEVRIDIHYLSIEGEIDDQIGIIDKMSDFFGSQVNKGYLSLDLSSNSSREIANIRLLSHSIDDTGINIAMGERRIIFHTEMDIPQFITSSLPTLRRIDIDAKIAEKLDTP